MGFEGGASEEAGAKASDGPAGATASRPPPRASVSNTATQSQAVPLRNADSVSSRATPASHRKKRNET